MQQVRVAEFELSRLMLGTAQFGLRYGVANTTGQPSFEDCCAILVAAREGGVNCLDTASSYGVSEEVIGEALQATGLADEFVVVTKIYAMGDDFSSQVAIDEFVEKSVATSLARLHLDVLPLCLFHKEENYRYIDSLLKLKERGLVRHIGSSTVSPEGVAGVLDTGTAEAIQIPTNMLDQRFTRAGLLSRARQAGVAVFVRSVYLQGLLLMPETSIPPDLESVKPLRQALDAIAREAGLPMDEMAVRYVLALDGVTCALTGVDTVAQMRANCQLFSKAPLAADTVAAIQAAITEVPENLLKPFTWSTRMADIKPINN